MKLKEMRIKQKLTQKKLAELADINLRSLQFYEQENNIHTAHIDTIIKICLILKCDLLDIIEDKKTIELLKQYKKEV